MRSSRVLLGMNSSRVHSDIEFGSFFLKGFEADAIGEFKFMRMSSMFSGGNYWCCCNYI